MKIGVIGRCDNRGIAYQSYEAAVGLDADKVLLVRMNDPKWPEDPTRWNGFDVYGVDSDMISRDLPHKRVKTFLAGLDAVFAVETLYDWRMADWAREAGVRTVVQGNPEFYVHHQEEWAHPDQWVWPTAWMREGGDFAQRIGGPVLPVPAPNEYPKDIAAATFDDETLRVLHVAGHRAIGDRNGTDLVIEALANIRAKVHVTIIGQDGWLPELNRIGKQVTIELNDRGVEDRWDLYKNQHVTLLPRRYGGLCLPAIESTVCGIVPMMPDVNPNRMWPIHPVHSTNGRLQRVKYGHVRTRVTKPLDIAREIDSLAHHRDKLLERRRDCLAWAKTNTWDHWRHDYEQVLAG